MRKEPRDYQKEAIEAVVKGFETTDRGQLIMPCGTGKTLISLWIYEKLKPKKMIMLFPSLALLRQTKDEWKKESKDLPPYLCICSESKIDVSHDEIKIDIKDVDITATNNSNSIKEFLDKNKEFIIFTTYQSIPLLLNSNSKIKIKFDLVICDEAHKIAGYNKTLFSIINDNYLINISKRLYMTATPKILRKYSKNKKEQLTVSCMNDQKIYGLPFYKMGFSEAIELKILVDYEIILIGVSDHELSYQLFDEKKLKMNVRDVINNIALNKSMQIYDINQVISFHSSVRKAKEFCKFHNKNYENINCYHINGSQKTDERNKILNNFRNPGKTIITNARCLTEGIDVPSVDAVFFSDGKSSKIDIIQAVGRAIRNKKDKTKAYIIVPIYHNEGEMLEDISKDSKFFNIISVIRALGTQDERIIENYKGEKIHTSKLKNSISKFNPIKILGFDKNIENKLFYEIIERLPIEFLSFEEARSFVINLGLKNLREWKNYTISGLKPKNIPANPPAVYNVDWVNWGDWLGTGRFLNTYFMEFSEARNLIRSMKFRSSKEYMKFQKKEKLIYNLPIRPDNTYKGKGWINWSDWLGVINNNCGIRTGTSYDDARKFALNLNLNCSREWHALARSGKLPHRISNAPDRVYQDKGWISWNHFLGTERGYRSKKLFMSYDKAKKIVQKLNLKNKSAYNKYCRIKPKIRDLPWNPESSYKNMGWISWEDYLGKDEND